MSINYYYDRLVYNIHEPARFLGSTSPRKMLLWINFVIAVLALGLSGFSIYLSFLLYDGRLVSGWAVWLGLSAVGFTLATICSIGMRGAHVLSLELLLTYFWGLTVCIAPLMLGAVASFDFLTYERVWFEHKWAEPRFYRVRQLFCSPKSSISTKCAPPITGINNSITAWCIYNFGDTDCIDIRDSAIQLAVSYTTVLTIMQGLLAILILLLIGWSMYICLTIITSPVITQSMNDVINYLLLIPIVGSAAVAVNLWFLKDYDIQYSWLAEFLTALGGAVTIAIPLGIISGRLKSRLLLTSYLILVSLTSAGYATSGTLGLLIGKVLLYSFKPTAEVASNIACQIHLEGCSRCEENSGIRCPEWSTNDVLQQLVAYLHIAGAIAFISMLYLVGGIIVASILHSNLQNYKSDYV